MPLPLQKLRHLRIAGLSLLVSGTLGSWTLPATAQAPKNPAPDLAAAYNDAVTDFEMGNFQAAALKLEEILAHAPKEAQIETVYFTLGAAYFNAEQYPKAIDTLRKYLQLYPKGARVIDATFSLGQAALRTKDYAEAATQFSKLVNVPALREQALFYAGLSLKENQRPDQAIKMLEALITPEIRSSLGAKAAMLLAALYGEKKDAAKVIAVVSKILQKSEFVENLAQFNGMTVELGDSYAQEGRPADALMAYRMTRTREQIVRFQAERVQVLERRLQQFLAAMRANPNDALSYIKMLPEMKQSVVDAQKTLEDAKQLPEIMPGVMLRMARAYYDMGQRWESTVAYDEMMTRYPEAKERETALFATMVNFAELNRPVSAQGQGEKYLKEFPQGPNAPTVGYLMGATALQANDPKSAESYFGRMLTDQPDSSFKSEMIFLLGAAQFAQGKFEESIKEYQQYRDAYPTGAHAEEVDYRIAVAQVFAGKYEAAIPELEKYLQKFPKGTYASDARYRLALCYYAASQYDDTIKRCRAWEDDYGQDQQLGEVLALRADSLMAKGETEEATETYIRSFKVATTDEVLSYSLNEAQKGLQKKGDWARISTIFEEFIKDHPEHSLVPMAIYWIAKARVHEGQIDEAKNYIAAAIKKYIDDPKRDSVEALITQLSQLCVRKKRAAAPPMPVAADTINPAEELLTLLGNADSLSPTAKARILFARSELAISQRKPDEQRKWLLAIAEEFPPEALSPMLLARAGDSLLETDKTEQAVPFFRYLLDVYPQSPFVDFASNGLGEIAFQNKDFPEALRLFSAPVDAGKANQKLKELTLGQAKTLLALDRLDEAQKAFEQVASVRSWRGEATAQAVYSLGEIECKRGNWTAANAYYQRVFVAYQKYLPWVARAYLQSAQCFEKLGQKQDAAKTYQELLRQEKLSSFEETTEARKRLQSLIGGIQG